DYYLAASPFRYVDGVLLAEVIAEDSHGFRVRERFDTRPDPTQAPELALIGPDDVYEYYLRVVDGNLEVELLGDDPRSRLFPMTSGRQLPIDDLAGDETTIVGWRAGFDYCECYREGFVANGEVRGAAYERLNIVMDDEPMQVDGDGATKLYSAGA